MGFTIELQLQKYAYLVLFSADFHELCVSVTGQHNKKFYSEFQIKGQVVSRFYNLYYMYFYYPDKN